MNPNWDLTQNIQWIKRLEQAEPALTRREENLRDQSYTKESGLSPQLLMEQAASAAFWYVHNHFTGGKWAEASESKARARRHIVILCGVGNNAGDGWALARQLTSDDLQVTVLDCSPDSDFSPETAANRKAISAFPVSVYTISKGGTLPDLGRPDLIVDALFGTGFRAQRGLSDHFKECIKWVNLLREKGVPVLSLDVPSGVDSDTGAVADGAVQADICLCFDHLKRGLAIMPGLAQLGSVHVLPIGIPPVQTGAFESYLINRKLICSLAPERGDHSYKGSFGRATLLTGSRQYPGAAHLSIGACLRTGAGYVQLISCPEVISSLNGRFPEALTFNEGSAIERERSMLASSAIGCGCGWSTQSEHLNLLRIILNQKKPVVLDADALNLLAEAGQEAQEWMQERVERYGSEALLLTPHIGEFRRLFPDLADQVDQDRFEALKKAVTLVRCPILLKDSCSILAIPFESLESTLVRFFILNRPNSGLARAGSGDFLTGLITGIAAQGLSLMEAALAALWVQAEAADLATRTEGKRCIRIGELEKYLPAAFNQAGWNEM